ncbi:VOC family protein [Amycolatopsis sp. CB00013]|uniref:VOC family protein n=1 Tax=Amycolatopsis sp. CB00013 TaxID=1703945 RepID=UPI00093E64C2|nr:VOC family protein [Amycolatopsis sp. CB00013]OKK00370.1 dioxygenase [Amycolatopsis sp. CB00013]
MATEITRLHHAGHVVRDMSAALDLYRRLGFVTPAPGYPAMPPRAGGEPEPFGAANTHADFPGDFLELATVVTADGHVPPGARLVPLQAPPDVLPTLVERIDATRANLAECLERFEGLHILMFSSSDIDVTATRLTAAGVGHGGVNTVRRPAGGEVETVRYLEIDGTRPGLEAEGRIGVVADLDPRVQATRLVDHPNGAVGLVDAVLCTADAELDAVQARYEHYLGRAPRKEGPSRVFDLDGATLTLVPASGLTALFPGEQAPALPALVSCTVAVHDLTAAENLLRNNKVPLVRTPSGDVFVPSTAALGTAIAFRQAEESDGQGSATTVR